MSENEGERLISQVDELLDEEGQKLHASFQALTKSHLDGMLEQLGRPMTTAVALLLMSIHTPRTYAADHVECVACFDLEDKTQCLAFKMCDEVTKFADEAGHPEWVDGDPRLD